MFKHKSLILLFLMFAVLSRVLEVHGEPTVVVVEVKGGINEGAYILILRASRLVTETNAAYLVVVLDTYGGYMYSMDKIIRELAKCPCKKIIWVPPGAKAVSAGAIIALSGDEILVGEGAVIGACRPRPEDRKVIEYVKARIRSLAEKRRLNATVVRVLEEMVEENRAFSAEEIVNLGLARGYAKDLEDVLSFLGVERAKVVLVESDILSDIAAVIFDPGIALAMLIIGVLLILLEAKATGFQGWGIIGGVLITLSLYVLGVIGWSLMTLVLVILGFVSLILELKKPGLQIFGITGVSLLILAILLEYLRQPFINMWSYALPVMLFTGTISSILFIIILKASEAIRLKKLDYKQRLVGKEGYAKTVIEPGRAGVVYVEGEDWTAISRIKIEKGDKVKVVGVEGLTLVVEKVNR